MRMIHVVPAVTEEASGPSYSVVRLCQSLNEAGEDLTLAAMDWSPLPSTPAFLKVFPLGAGPRRLGRSPNMCRWLMAETKEGGVDVVHSHGMWQMNAIYPGWAAKSGKTKLVASPRGAFSAWAMNHGSRFKRIFWPLIQRPALMEASCFHATSDAEYEDIRRLGFAQPVAVIPNGIDVPPDQPCRNGEESHLRTLLFLGRIHKVKGLELLLRAWSRLQARHSDWRLRIVGSDEGYYGSSGYLSALKNMANSLALQRIEFAGALVGNDKWNALVAADLFVTPSFSENFAVAVAEALASGTPAIVTHGAPWGGLVERRAGWWVETSINALESALDDAMSKPRNYLKDMGARGRQWMLEEFSWEFVAGRMLDTYKWLLAVDGPPPAWVRVD